MSQECEGNVKAFITGEALEAFCRIKLSAGMVIYSDAGEDWIGTTLEKVASGTRVGIKLRTAAGTRKMRAAGAFSAGAQIYGADDGEIDDVAIGQVQGIALEAASAAHDIVEVITGTDLTAAIASLADATLGLALILREQYDASEVKVFDGDCPRKILVIDCWTIPSEANGSGTVKLTDGTNDITNAIVAAVDKTIGRAVTIDDAYNTIAANGSLSIVPANSAAGEMFIVILPIA